MGINVTYHTDTITVNEMIRHHYDAERFGECCRQCPRYGRYEMCPPFSYSPLQRIRQYANITFMMARLGIDTNRQDSSSTQLSIQSVSDELRRRLLQAEARTGGQALLLARDNLRPSPEGWGINVTSVAEKVFGMPIEWGEGGQLPNRLTMIGAVLHNSAFTSEPHI